MMLTPDEILSLNYSYAGYPFPEIPASSSVTSDDAEFSYAGYPVFISAGTGSPPTPQTIYVMVVMS